MNNKEINALRARINRTRKTVDQIGRAAHATLLDLDDMSAMLDDIVVAPTNERPARVRKTPINEAQAMTPTQFKRMIAMAVDDALDRRLNA